MPCRSASRAPADSPKMKSLHLGDPKLRCEFGAAQFSDNPSCFSQCHDVNISKCSLWSSSRMGLQNAAKIMFEATRKQKKNECQMMKNYILNTPGTIRFISGVHSKTDSGLWNNLEAHGTCGKPNNHPQLRPYQPSIWVCLKMSCTPKPNGFADHYPY